jgi:hypothetical protein
MATNFDEYFFGGGLEQDAAKAVHKAIDQAKAAGLPLDAAMNPPESEKEGGPQSADSFPSQPTDE